MACLLCHHLKELKRIVFIFRELLKPVTISNLVASQEYFILPRYISLDIICWDTETNSTQAIKDSSAFSQEYFRHEIITSSLNFLLNKPLKNHETSAYGLRRSNSKKMQSESLDQWVAIKTTSRIFQFFSPLL